MAVVATGQGDAGLKPYLTSEEIAEITEPRTQGAARIRFFRQLGVKVEARPNGQPLVWRADFEAARMHDRQAANDGRQAQVDWTEFDKKVRYGRDGEKAQRRQSARPRAAR